MASHPIRVTPNFEKQFYIACDAFDRAIAGCLFQVIDQFEHPICYIRQKSNCHQKAYSTIEKEALSLLIAIRRFSVYFGSHEVIVYTDHYPLTFLDRMSNTNNQLLCWRLELQEYKLLIKHRKGTDNVILDILSRPPEVDITKF